jgi:uncharacterized phage protein (TIGR01671 family)
MSRENKYRAWDSKYEKMYYSHGENPRVNLFHGKWEIDLEGDNGDTIGTVECDEKTYPLMEYIGLKDKNGVEICEGDVVFVPYNYIGNQVVSFNKGKYNISSYNISKLKIVGNIHQDPKLLKQ